MHIPFCDVHCGYCDFNTYTAKEIGSVKQSEFHLPLVKEIEFSKVVLAESEIVLPPLSSVFFGGGTPSLFTLQQIQALYSALVETHGILDQADVTLEANPDSVDFDYLLGLRSAGINRLSVGVQSFDQDVLNTLDRTHRADSVPQVIRWAKDAGLRTSLDLIYGAPGESLESWAETLQQAIEMGTEHISAYCLIVEPGTKLAAKIRRGELASPDEDLNAQKQELTSQMLEAAGLPWYEVANWGLPSIHNKSYWYSRNWWGYGPGAHSHIAGNRFWNKKHPLTYQQAIQVGSPVAGLEVIDHRTHLEERLMLELRCVDGTELSLLRELEVSQQKVSTALAEELLVLLPGARIAVSAKGRLLIDGLVLQLLT